jgi:TRAP-type mannitol/chloroaromatic compound transport system substrate-binding protein
MCQQYITRVNDMAGGRLKIDLLHGGAVVHPFQVLDGVHGGQIDAAHTVTVYWYGKHKAASLFGTGPVFGFNANEGLGWIHNGGGKELFEELQVQIMKQRQELLRYADANPTARLVQEAHRFGKRHAGHEVSHRRSGG